jgi:hypothetical protein
MTDWRKTNIDDCRLVSTQAMPLEQFAGSMAILRSAVARSEKPLDFVTIVASGYSPEAASDVLWDVVIDFEDDAASCEEVARLLGADDGTQRRSSVT